MGNSPDASIWILNFICTTIKITMTIFIIIVYLWKSFECETLDLSKTIKNFAVSIFLELFIWIVPSFFLEIYGFKTYVSDSKNPKGEKIVELTESEKIKKINAYRKSKNKDILLAGKTESEHYINYLKKNDLYEKALK